MDNGNIIDSFNVDENYYVDYDFDMDIILYNFIQIEKITNYLESNILNTNIVSEIDDIMKIVNK